MYLGFHKPDSCGAPIPSPPAFRFHTALEEQVRGREKCRAMACAFQAPNQSQLAGEQGVIPVGIPPSEIKRPGDLFRVTAVTWRRCDPMLVSDIHQNSHGVWSRAWIPSSTPGSSSEFWRFCPSEMSGTGSGSPGGQGQVNRIPA